jgi:glycosyltransferase involved in cell wall biosynthesis
VSGGLIEAEAEQDRADRGTASVRPNAASVLPAVEGVLFVSHAAEMGGAEQGLIDLACHFGPARCEVLLLADGGLRRMLEARHMRVHVLPARRSVLGVRRAGSALRALAAVPDALLLAVRVAAAAKGHRVIYANSQKAALIAMLAGVIARRPVIWHLHDILSADHFGRLQRHAMAVLATPLTRAVIVVSAAAREAFVASGGSARRVRLIHNGIDPRPYAGLADMSRGELRAALGLAPGKLIGLFGRITEWKGQRVLIEALALLPDIRALIVGSPFFGEEAEDAHLKALAERLGVSGRVAFLGHRADGPRLMRAVDLVVHCSTAPEPFGRVIVEALIAGSPVLAAEGGACREIMGDSDWVAPPGDPRALAAAIGRILGETEATRAKKLALLRSRMMAHFSLAQMIRRVEGVIAEVA